MNSFLKFSKYSFFLFFILFTFSNCNTEVIEKVIEKNIHTPIEVDPNQGKEEKTIEIDPEIEIGTETGNPSATPTQDDGIEFSNPELPSKGDNLDGIEFSNPELPSKSQKGPFYMDSDIFIQEIQIQDNHMRLSGNIFIDRVTDNLGTFILPDNLSSPYLEIRVNGYYFNEVSGQPSDGTISLGSYSSIKDGKAPNINILTTLAQKRIKHLIQEENLGFEEAETQAKIEVLRSFHIQDELENFDELKIDGNSEGDAALLAISIVLQGELSTVELSNFIARIREDLRENGRIDDRDIYDIICDHTQNINPIDIRNNLTQYYESLRIEDYQIPIFEDYLDSDCNGVINKEDPESFIFFSKFKSEAFNRFGNNTTIIPYKNRLFIFSEQRHLRLHYSEDFETWHLNSIRDLLVSNPISVEWRDKLYIFGGKYYCGRLLGHVFLPDQYSPNSLETISLDVHVMGIHTINRDFEFEKIRDNGYCDYNRIDPIIRPNLDFVRAHLNQERDDNIYPNYSSTNHSLRIINDKLYVSSIDNANPHLGFYGAQVSEDGINWEEDYLSEHLDEKKRFLYDFIQFNNNIFTAYFDIGTLDIEIDKLLIELEAVARLNRTYIYGINIYKSYASFTKYSSKLFFSGWGYGNIIIKYSSDGEIWNNLTLPPFFNNAIPMHRTILFKDLMHIITEERILSFGHYQYYKSYLNLE